MLFSGTDTRYTSSEANVCLELVQYSLAMFPSVPFSNRYLYYYIPCALYWIRVTCVLKLQGSKSFLGGSVETLGTLMMDQLEVELGGDSKSLEARGGML